MNRPNPVKLDPEPRQAAGGLCCPNCGHSVTEAQLARSLRSRAIAAAYRGGMTQAELAEVHGLTRPRISQILGELGARGEGPRYRRTK